MWAELAWVALRDEDEVMLRNSRAWPPPVPSPARVFEGERLHVLGARFAYRAREMGFVRQGVDHVFGDDPQEGPLFGEKVLEATEGSWRA